MNRELVGVREYIDIRINQEKELREQFQQESKMALILAQKNIDVRLHAANEFKELINGERGKYITRELADKTNEIIDTRIKSLELISANYAGRLWMFMFLSSGLGAIIAIIINLIIAFYRKP